MQYWLMKSEPSEFSIDDLERAGIEPWDGVRNYQVRNMFRDQFRIDDRALFYHSNCSDIGIVGEMSIVSQAYPDPTQFDSQNAHYDPQSTVDNPRWLLVDVQFVAKFSYTITRKELSEIPEFNTSVLLQKGNRLSVLPITHEQYQAIHTRAVT